MWCPIKNDHCVDSCAFWSKERGICYIVKAVTDILSSWKKSRGSCTSSTRSKGGISVEYVYLVAYHHRTGVTTSTILRSSKLNTIAKVEELKKLLEKENGHENIGIINILLVERRWRKKKNG